MRSDSQPGNAEREPAQQLAQTKPNAMLNAHPGVDRRIGSCGNSAGTLNWGGDVATHMLFTSAPNPVVAAGKATNSADFFAPVGS